MDETPTTFEGPLLDERYRLGPVLGRGGQGSTHLAMDERSGAQVAVKTFELAKAAGWKELELFRRQGEALRQLDHPGIPRYLGEIEEDGGARAYLVMELVPGRSLQERARDEGPLNEPALWEILEGGLEILAYLETRQPPVVHRDVKPGNLIQRPDGSLALVDFGGVKLRPRSDGGSTVVGTFGYMAPEQLYGQATPATDLYGLGATLLALGSGLEPEDLPRRGLKVDMEAALPVSAGLRRVIERLTEPDPARRPASATAMLAEVRVGEVQAPVAAGEGLPLPWDWEQYAPPWMRGRVRRRRGPRLPVRVLLLVLFLVLGPGVPWLLGLAALPLGLVVAAMAIWVLAPWSFRRRLRAGRRRYVEQRRRRVRALPPGPPAWDAPAEALRGRAGRLETRAPRPPAPAYPVQHAQRQRHGRAG